MTDPCGSPSTSRALSAGQIAEMVGGRVDGDPSVLVEGVAPLEQALEAELGFLAQRRYLRFLPETRAQALLVSDALAEAAVGHPSRVVVEDPHQVLPAILAHFYPTPVPEPGIHPTAVLGKGVRMGEGITIAPYAVVEERAVLGNRVRLGAHSVIGAGCVIGDDSVIHPHVVLYPGTRLGARVILHSGVQLGVDGFGYVPVDGEIRKIPQVGACELDDDVEVGANTCIDRGSIGRTTIGKSTKIDNLVHLAHNVQVGRGVFLAAATAVAGSARIGDGVMTGGQAGINGHVEVGAGVRIGGQGGVIGDIPPGQTVSGFPARDNREYLRAMGMVFKLPETVRRLREVEERLAALEKSEEG
ncbi:MAG: UDP-3-O-(3-hydroxymyristoyl)glucosamine N-acyltransferase [Longimicrobiales bacterium]|nr:UDP-3-O-(3-hydroxymyristoyl)glucosamine N-acyltransferase [Longimicrobiales bacterium]